MFIARSDHLKTVNDRNLCAYAPLCRLQLSIFNNGNDVAAIERKRRVIDAAYR
jgi:hypothetical protein